MMERSDVIALSVTGHQGIGHVGGAGRQRQVGLSSFGVTTVVGRTTAVHLANNLVPILIHQRNDSTE